MSDQQDKQPLHGPDFVLDVGNFGPIAEAREIVFKPMTVFVGPSNTGKSYLALLLHSLLKGFDDARVRGHPMGIWNPQSRFAELAALWLETAELAVDGINDGRPNQIGVSAFAAPNRSFLEDNVDYLLAQRSDSMAASIYRYFEVDEFAELSNHRDRHRTVPGIKLRKSSDAGDWIFSLDSDGPSFEIAPSMMSWSSERLAEVVLRIDGTPEARDLVRLLSTYVNDLTRKIGPSYRSWYFPTSRTGILVSHRVLAFSVLDQASWVGLGDGRRDGPDFHKIAADFLRDVNVIDLKKRRPRMGTVRDDFGPDGRVAETIEQSVLLGKIGIERNEYGPPEFVYAPNNDSGVSFPMASSSSMVTELAPIVAFLRSHIEAGDLLIIEEPEAHLHPAAQQRLAGVLAYMVRQGLRVLITTHSHYMVEAMGMFLNSARVGPEKRADSMRLLGDEIDRELYLREDEVAVYSFDQAPEAAGTVVKEVPFDEGSLSFAPSGHSDALVDQFNRISRVVAARIDADELAEAS